MSVVTQRTTLGGRNRSSRQVGANEMFDHLFGDDLVTATDLNRKPGKILDRAVNRPVTITRNDESFALLRRPVAQNMFHRYQDSLRVAEVMKAILKCTSSKMAPQERFGWLLAFDNEELLAFMDELVGALEASSLDLDSQEETICVEDIIHEWRESAVALLSSAHEEAFRSRVEEPAVPLTNPEDIVLEP